MNVWRTWNGKSEKGGRRESTTATVMDGEGAPVAVVKVSSTSRGGEGDNALKGHIQSVQVDMCWIR